MKKRQSDPNSLEVPEISQHQPLRKSRHQLSADAPLPKRKVNLELEADLLAWFEAEARRGGLTSTEHINKALRQYIVALVGDKAEAPVASLNEKQRAEVRKLVDESLRLKGLLQPAAA